jgi:DNA-directed RNA polymerase subunit RPC12/RpoP
MKEHFIRKLLSTVKCSSCGKQFGTNDINVIKHQDDTWFLNIYCPSCGKQSLVVAIVRKDKSAEIVSNVSDVDPSEYASDSAISVDDMLDIHNFLKDFDGDFTDLFSKK